MLKKHGSLDQKFLRLCTKDERDFGIQKKSCNNKYMCLKSGNKITNDVPSIRLCILKEFPFNFPGSVLCNFSKLDSSCY